jgi:hypothetical protein
MREKICRLFLLCILTILTTSQLKAVINQPASLNAINSTIPAMGNAKPNLDKINSPKANDLCEKYCFQIIGGSDQPVIQKSTPGAKGIKYGFEGGVAFKHENQYHYFTAERVGEPRSVKMKFGHWISPDGLKWKRKSTLYKSSGDYTGKDPRAALWSPMPFFNKKENRWNLFYVAYRAKPDWFDASGKKLAWYRNYEGTVWRAVSSVPGPSGLGGPYVDAGIVLKPGPDSDPWEGLQGTDSFYIYTVEDEFYAFYGSSHTHIQPCPWWGVGLAKSSQMAGQWKRCSELNPVNFNIDVENPIVIKTEQGFYAAVCDLVRGDNNSFAYAFSADGLNWTAKTIDLSKKVNKWWTTMRTPVSLIYEGNDIFTVYYCAYTKNNFECVGRVQFKLVKK